MLSEAQGILWSLRQRDKLVFKGLAAADGRVSAGHAALVYCSVSWDSMWLLLSFHPVPRYYKILKGMFDIFSAKLTMLHLSNNPVRLF